MNNSTIFIKGKIVPTIKIKGKTNASIIRIYPELENIEITPKVEDQEFQSEMYGYDKVKVKGVQSYIDEDIKPEYIKKGVDILGVVGNVIELQGEEKTVVPTREQQEILPSEGKNAMTKIIVQALETQEEKIIPSTEEQVVEGLISKVTVLGDSELKPENIKKGVTIFDVEGGFDAVDTRDATATSNDIIEGTTAYVNNQKIDGNVPNNGELEYNPSDEEQAIPAGLTSGGTVKAADITKLSEYEACLTLANSIEDLEDYSDTTATAEDIVEGKTAYSNGEKIIGKLELPKGGVGSIDALETGATTSNQISSIYKKIKYLPEDLTLSGTDGSYMFGYCESLEEIPETLDTSNITKTTGMFIGCISLKKIPLLDLSKVISSLRMFNGCLSLKEIPLLNTSSITNMGYMFSGCSSLEKVPLLNTSNNSGTKSTMQSMFSGCTNLTDESLNNILAMCINATKFSNEDFMKLSYIGLTSAQATRCQSLSNYQAFLNAGWTTGY